MNTDDQGIIRMLEDKITAHEEKINSFRQAIKALSGSSSGNSSSQKEGKKRRGRKPGSKNLKRGRKSLKKNESGNKPVKVRKQRNPRTGETFESWVMKQFGDNTPKSTRALLDLYNKETGRNLDISGVSARISILKKKGSVMSSKGENDGVAYHGKSDWFDNGKLKDDYLPKASTPSEV